MVIAASRLELVRDGPPLSAAREGRRVGQRSRSEGDVSHRCWHRPRPAFPAARKAARRCHTSGEWRSAIRSAEVAHRENPEKCRGPARHQGVSGWDSPTPYPRTPRNRGNFPACSRSGRSSSGYADSMAEEGVHREPVSVLNSLIYGKIQGIATDLASLRAKSPRIPE